MKAMVWEGGYEFHLREVDHPDGPAPHEVKVKTQATAVCATEFHIFSGELEGFSPPMVTGHESTGIVVEIGENVAKLKPGDRVVLEPTIGCQACFVCKAGMTHLCPRDEWQFFGANHQGTMAEFYCVPEYNVHKVPESISPAAASLLEPLACCIHGMEFMPEPGGKDILITGAGFSAILFVQLLRPLAHNIFVTGTRDMRLEMARRFGADGTVNIHKEDMVTAGRRFFGEKGADMAIDCAGADGIITPLIDLIARQGDILVYSYIPHPQDISVAALLFKEASLRTSTSCADCIPQSIEIVSRGEVDLESMITHRFTLDEVEEAYRVTYKEKDTCLKAVVEVDA